MLLWDYFGAASTAADAGDLVSSKNWPLKGAIAAGRHVFHDMQQKRSVEMGDDGDEWCYRCGSL